MINFRQEHQIYKDKRYASITIGKVVTWYMLHHCVGALRYVAHSLFAERLRCGNVSVVVHARAWCNRAREPLEWTAIEAVGVLFALFPFVSAWRSSPTRTRSLRAPYIGVLSNGFSARVLSFITFTQNSAGFSLCAFAPLLFSLRYSSLLCSSLSANLLFSLLCSSLLVSESTSSRLCLSLVVHDSNNCVTSRHFKLGQHQHSILYYTYILEKCLEILQISHNHKFLQISNLISYH